MKRQPQNRQKTGSRKLRSGRDPSIGRATQFKPGQSGNPGGRPKTPITDAYRDQLAQLKQGDRQKRTFAELIADAQIRKAVKGITQMNDPSSTSRFIPFAGLSGLVIDDFSAAVNAGNKSFTLSRVPRIFLGLLWDGGTIALTGFRQNETSVDVEFEINPGDPLYALYLV